MAAENRGTEMFSRVIFVKFEGYCSPEHGAGAVVSGQIPLAATTVTEEGVTPYSTVDCQAVRRLVFSGDNVAIRREHFMGRALGRVLAHELLHALARTHQHTHHGVGREKLNKDDLTRSIEDFDSDEKRSLRFQVEKSGGRPTKAFPWSGNSE
jgi:hypothetical protein